MTTTIGEIELRAILAGLEGVTPGPWDEAAGLVRAIDGDVAIPIFETREPWKKHRRTSTVVKQEWHNRHHIARLDPDTVRSIVTELLDRRKDGLGTVSPDVMELCKALSKAVMYENGGGTLPSAEVCQEAALVLNSLARERDFLAKHVVNEANRADDNLARALSAEAVAGKPTIPLPEAWMLEPAAIYLEMVDDDETGSNIVVAKYLRALSCLTSIGVEAGWKGASYLAETRKLMAEAKDRVKPIVGGPEGETIMAYEIPTGLWLMLQAHVRNLIDTLPEAGK